MEAMLTTKRERQATFADELAFTKIKQVFQILRRGNHFTRGYLDIQDLWAKGFMMLAERIRGAGRIRLTDPVSSMAQQVAANRPSTLLQALPLYRLPYSSTWFEWDPQERRADEKQFAPNGLTVPRFEGVLLEALEPTLRRFCAIPVWRHFVSDIPLMPSTVMVFDFRPEGRPTESEIEQHLYVLLDHNHKTGGGYFKDVQRNMDEALAMAEFGLRCRMLQNPFLDSALVRLERRDPAMYARLEQEAAIDTSGDARFVVAILALLHARNATERTPVKADGGTRIRFDGPPLMAHHVMSLNLSRVAGNRISGGNNTERRAHLVRGHFKIRKTTRTPEGVDLFWWNPHIRGG